MKIAILSMYSGIINRGVESWTSEIATRLDHKGHEVLVFQPTNSTQYPVKQINYSAIWSLGSGEKKLTNLLVIPYWIYVNAKFTIKCLPSLISFKPDIIIPNNGEVMSLIISVASKLFNWKMVLIGHAGLGAPDKWNLLTRPDYFIFPSKRAVKWARALWYSRGIKTSNISHGIDLEKFKPTGKKAKTSLKKPIVLCVSSLEPFKRVHLAVNAVSQIKNASLLIVGGHRSQGVIDKLAKKKLGTKYKKTETTHEKMPSYYRAADVFTLPSQSWEAFGIVYLEAMACNIPVVATDDELRREIVGDAGLLIDPTDIDAYSRALKKALNTNWGNRPRKQAEKFSWDIVIDKYEKLFISLLNKI